MSCTEVAIDGAAPVGNQTLYVCPQSGCCYGKADTNVLAIDNVPHCLFHTEIELVENEVPSPTYGRAVCRTDPHFEVGGTYEFDIAIMAQTDSENIDDVLYEVHMPAGLELTDFSHATSEHGEVTSAVDDNDAYGVVVLVTVVSEDAALVQASIAYGDGTFKALGVTNEPLRLALDFPAPQ